MQVRPGVSLRPAGRPETASTLEHQEEDQRHHGQEEGDQEKIPADVASVGSVGHQTHFPDGFNAPAADSLDGDIRVGPARDRLDLAVDQAEPDQFGEGPGLAIRGEPVESVAFAADDESFEPEGRVRGKLAPLFGGLRSGLAFLVAQSVDLPSFYSVPEANAQADCRGAPFLL